MPTSNYLLGYDIGSSSVKACLLDAQSGTPVATAQSPDGISTPQSEMGISAPKVNWAEQDPELWWEHLLIATRKLRQQAPKLLAEVGAIGIAYQMHGLVLVDENGAPLRPAIIWCDSRAVESGEKARRLIGDERCMAHLLNYPGNFTAAKLLWVKEHEPEIYRRTKKLLLPGDYIAFRLSGELQTTPSGLSEAILWDYHNSKPAELVMGALQLRPELLPSLVGTFTPQCSLTRHAAELLGLTPGVPICYRAGDQPNNAFSLGANEEGEVAANAGTSAVIYAVSNSVKPDRESSVNTFLHVTDKLPPAQGGDSLPRYGTLLCINGSGSAYSWLRSILGSCNYDQLNLQASATPIGSEGLVFLPFGNGAERCLSNSSLGAGFANIHFNTHRLGHMVRAVQEGIAFALRYGFEHMQSLGINPKLVAAGKANLFLSSVFREAFISANNVQLVLRDTDGAQGAARAAGLGLGLFSSAKEAYRGLQEVSQQEPDPQLVEKYDLAYQRWTKELRSSLERN